MPFTLFHRAGNGILAVASGTVPLTVFGPENDGCRLGLVGAPARIHQAAAPIPFGLRVDRFGVSALIVSSAISLSATVAVLAVANPR
jgi:hypothetical protein